MRLADVVDSFVVSCRARGTIGERTIENYLRDLDLFTRRFPGKLEDVTKDHVRLFLGTRGWAASTRLIRFKSLDALFTFCVEDGLLDRTPMTGVERPRGAKKARKPEHLQEQDMDLLLMVWPEWTWMGLRNRAILWAFFTMPFRLAELAGIQSGDVDLREFSIRARKSKGNDEGYSATLFPKCAQAIDRYRRKLPKEWQDTEYLWVNQKGQPLTPHAIQEMLQRTEKRAKAVGFTKHFGPHSYRHNWGMRTVQWGMPLDLAADTMGQRTTDAAKLYRQWERADEARKFVRKVAGFAS